MPLARFERHTPVLRQHTPVYGGKALVAPGKTPCAKMRFLVLAPTKIGVRLTERLDGQLTCLSMCWATRQHDLRTQEGAQRHTPTPQRAHGGEGRKSLALAPEAIRLHHLFFRLNQTVN